MTMERSRCGGGGADVGEGGADVGGGVDVGEEEPTANN